MTWASDVQYPFANSIEGLPDVKVVDTFEQVKSEKLPDVEFDENIPVPETVIENLA